MPIDEAERGGEFDPAQGRSGALPFGVPLELANPVHQQNPAMKRHAI